MNMKQQRVDRVEPEESGEYHRGVVERGKQAHSGLLLGRSQLTSTGRGRRSETWEILSRSKSRFETFNGETSRYWRVREVRLLKAKKSKLKRLEMNKDIRGSLVHYSTLLSGQ